MHPSETQEHKSYSSFGASILKGVSKCQRKWLVVANINKGYKKEIPQIPLGSATVMERSSNIVTESRTSAGKTFEPMSIKKTKEARV